MPAVLRARLRLRPGLAAHQGDQGRRRLAGHRSEDLDQPRPDRPHAILLARTGGTDPEKPRHRGITLLPAADGQRGRHRPAAAPHARRGRVQRGLPRRRASSPTTLVVGEVDGGWKVAMGTLGFERVAIATGRVNTTKAVRDIVDDVRRMQGRRRATRSAPTPAIRQQVADLWSRALVHRAIGQRVITGAAAGGPPGPVTSIGKLYFCPLVEDLADFRLSLAPLGGQFAVDDEDADDGVVAAARQPGPRHRDRRRVHLHPAQHRGRAHPRHAAGRQGVTYTWHAGRRLPREHQRHPADAHARRRRRSTSCAPPRWPTSARSGTPWSRTSRSRSARPYTQVVDQSRGVDAARVVRRRRAQRRRRLPGRVGRPHARTAVAVVHEAEDGAVALADLRRARRPGGPAARRAARARHRQGRRRRDLPPDDSPRPWWRRTPSRASARCSSRCSRASRPARSPAAIQDADAKAVITADGTVRRGRATADAAGSCARRSRRARRVAHGRRGRQPRGRAPSSPTARWRGASSLGTEPDPDVEPTGASDVLLLAYTSGTTGKPKGAVHTHAGFVTKTASEVAYGFEMAPGRTLLLDHRHGLDHGPALDLRHPRHRRHPRALRGLARRARHHPAVAARRAAPRQRCSASAPP